MRLLLLILTALSLTWSSTSWSHPVEGVPCARADAHASGARAEWGGSKGRLLYAQQRWLDPSTGRFLSLDPVQGVLSEPLSTQGFIYGRANPTGYVDPDGRCDVRLDAEGLPRADCLGPSVRTNSRLRRENESAFEDGRYGTAVGGTLLQVAFAPVLLAGLAADVTVGLAFNIGSSVVSLHNQPTPEKLERLAVDAATALLVAVDPMASAMRIDAVAGARAVSGTTKQALTFESVGAQRWSANAGADAVAAGGMAQRPRLTWNANPNGLRRTPDEARALLKEAGVDPGPGVKIEFVDRSGLANPEGALAEYGTFRPTRPGSVISEDDFFGVDIHGNIPVRVDSSLLGNDEALVAHIAHELHEVNGLIELFSQSGGRLPAQTIKAANAPNRGQNLHGQAWDAADAAVSRLRTVRGTNR